MIILIIQENTNKNYWKNVLKIYLTMMEFSAKTNKKLGIKIKEILNRITQEFYLKTKNN